MADDKNLTGEHAIEDASDEGRKQRFMTLDSWNQDGNYFARFDDFGPELEQEEPPTMNGRPME
jgi:hypothetical protein